MIDEPERIETVVGCIGEAGRKGVSANDRLCANGFGMQREKRVDVRWIGLTGLRIRAHRHELIVEALQIPDREHGGIVHARSPDFAVGQREVERHAPHDARTVRYHGHPARQREAAEHRYASGLEDSGFRILSTRAVAFEFADETYTLCMDATEARVNAVGCFELIDDARSIQSIAREPTARPGEGCRNGDDRHANETEPL